MDYTVNEAAEKLNVEPITVRRYIKQGILKATKHPKGFKFYYLISQEELDSFMQKLNNNNN